jgi:hypothetical protein
LKETAKYLRKKLKENLKKCGGKDGVVQDAQNPSNTGSPSKGGTPA